MGILISHHPKSKFLATKMKSTIISLMILFLLSGSFLYAEDDQMNREFAKKDLTLTFSSSVEVLKWSLESLDLNA
jgi:hypothetical protein